MPLGRFNVSKGVEKYTIINKIVLKSHFFAEKFAQFKKKQYLCTRFSIKRGPLAQLNRVPHYGCGGCRFESCMDHEDKQKECV